MAWYVYNRFPVQRTMYRKVSRGKLERGTDPEIEEVGT
jgi:hypothetical protein